MLKAHSSSAIFQQTNRLDSLKNMIVLAMASGYISEVTPQTVAFP